MQHMEEYDMCNRDAAHQIKDLVALRRHLFLLSTWLAPASAATAFTTTACVVVHVGQGHDGLEDREGFDRVWDRRGVYKVFLEPWLKRRFDFVDVMYGRLDLGARVAVKKGDPCACASRVACRCHLVKRRVWDHA